MSPLKKADMIPQAHTRIQPAGWQQELARGYSDVGELLPALGLTAAKLPQPVLADSPFRMRVPRCFVARMRPGDPNDPLLRQVLPLAVENEAATGFGFDPVGDSAAEVAPGVLHKYQGRALLITTGACAIHCRYCFRRHYPYAESHAALDQWQGALAHLRIDPSINEVILSGGDPLTLSDAKLAALVRELDAIAHLRRLRIHTRLPIVLPERVDARLLEWLRSTRLQKVIVLHANHANEVDASVVAAVEALISTGATVLNQAVLLAGVNDSVDALCELSETLFAARVLPYYLHLLDRVAGAAHFEVELPRALDLVERVRDLLPGYLIPRLVREQAGATSKLPVFA
jgi:EF-P beta-lysylation protein EpmB